jgi:mannose/fructose/N-acetylgalactosamine-specific phosphotransferase system component IIC
MPELLPAPGTLVLLALLGAWVAVDATSWGQVMVSRPMVTVLLAGLLLGVPTAVIPLAVLLEAAQLMVLPVGASRYPEAGPAAVAGTAVFSATDHGAAALLTTLVCVLAWEWVSGATVRRLRQFSVRYAASPGTAQLEPGALVRRHVGAIALDAARGALLMLIGLALMAAIMALAGPAVREAEPWVPLLTGGVLAGLLAAAGRLFSGRTRLFVAGAALGMVVAWLR